jgi:hypothetical protein
MNPYRDPAPPPGPGFGPRLALTDHWIDMYEHSHPLTRMSVDYLWNVLLYLHDHQEELAALGLIGPGMGANPTGSARTLAVTATPIWAALVAELLRRGQIRGPDIVTARLLNRAAAFRRDLERESRDGPSDKTELDPSD